MSDDKTLMTEQLPEPEVDTTDEAPRARVMRRFRRLRGSATHAAAAGLTAACGGFGCVDPLPPPAMAADCSRVFQDFRSAVRASSQWTGTGTTTTQVGLLLTVDDRDAPDALVLGTVTATSGGSVVSMTAEGRNLRAIIDADEDTPELLVDYDWTCNDIVGDKSGTQSLAIDLQSAQPTPGTRLLTRLR